MQKRICQLFFMIVKIRSKDSRKKYLFKFLKLTQFHWDFLSISLTKKFSNENHLFLLNF